MSRTLSLLAASLASLVYLMDAYPSGSAPQRPIINGGPGLALPPSVNPYLQGPGLALPPPGVLGPYVGGPGPVLPLPEVRGLYGGGPGLELPPPAYRRPFIGGPGPIMSGSGVGNVWQRAEQARPQWR
ncbi:unnamed protein product [Anisakis simplex]|uniref:Secreted protein n=1 Tax=Anisakis simplex TaxID=6269 RepID=A0A0M3JZR5_ANISI|nr:unnamed protein product [Anisakis simplex]